MEQTSREGIFFLRNTISDSIRQLSYTEEKYTETTESGGVVHRWALFSCFLGLGAHLSYSFSIALGFPTRLGPLPTFDPSGEFCSSGFFDAWLGPLFAGWILFGIGLGCGFFACCSFALSSAVTFSWPVQGKVRPSPSFRGTTWMCI